MSRWRTLLPALLLLAPLAACGRQATVPSDSQLAPVACASHPLIDARSGKAIAGAEDLAVLDGKHLVISAHDRRAVKAALDAEHPVPEGGLYLLKAERLETAEAGAPLALVPLAAPVPLRPHGIAAARDGRQTRLFVIDRRYRHGALGVRIWSFSLSGTHLVHPRLLAQGRAWCAANDLVLDSARNRLLVTLDHAACSGWRRWWEDLRAAPSGRVTSLPLTARKWPAPRGRPLLAGLRWPNGLALTKTAEGTRLWIAETRGHALVSLPLEGKRAGMRRLLPLPAAPDNLTRIAGDGRPDGDGGLLVAAHPSLFALALYRDHLFGRRRAQTMILRLAPDGRASTLYAEDGQRLSAATTAVIWAGRLIATSAWDSRMLVCQLDKRAQADGRAEKAE